ncbi:drug/metabolite transporter (DMT)-like permease [Oikeobacillus pervagus]|uniref:Drug/metabolite transporter (DMT)-like permease n=1 Tax=Oikeobacillus pervagus TaxID=1325931 RepID=A0AAJ1SYI8_9BACI|nr:DMT family transporter [Oikeobacillus pervagus]MDQ0214874.1 drug/metabolite transporter (DMT)-like permease [Oikeobacillus pervagus]
MKKPSPYFLLVLATILWGGNFVIGRAVSNQLPPYTLSFLRWCTALIIFIPFVWNPLKQEWKTIKERWPVVLFMALTGVAGFNTLVYIALHHTTSINASLVNSSTPIIIFIFSFVFFKEHLNRNQMLGTILSLGGVVFILSKGSFDNILSLSFNKGDLLMIVAVVCWSVYSIMIKKYSNILPNYSTFFVTIILGIIMLFPFFMGEVLDPHTYFVWSFSSFFAVLYIGTFASIVAFIAWNTAVSEIGANRAGIFLNFIPVFASIFAIIFIGESLAWYQLLGGLFVILGVYLSTQVSKKVKKNQFSPKEAS